MKIRYCRDCKYVLLPKYHSGFTGKSGRETWWMCGFHRDALLCIKKCNVRQEIKESQATDAQHGQPAILFNCQNCQHDGADGCRAETVCIMGDNYKPIRQAYPGR